MANSNIERLDDQEELLRSMLDAHQSKVQTGTVGTIVSFDPVKMTATVAPNVKARITKPDGTTEYQALPVIPDVPIQFPGGGGQTLTFPIKKGDECWLAFSSRDFSAWHQQGGVQPPVEGRMHDLSDAIAFVGLRSQKRPLSGGVSANTTQLRADGGGSFIELDGSGGIVRIVAPGGVVITAPTVTVLGDVIAGPNAVSLVNHVHPETGSVTLKPN